MKHKIKIIGCGVKSEDINESLKSQIIDSEILIAGERLLNFFPSFKGEKIPIKSDITKLLTKIKKDWKGKKISILASGDPLFFGIGRTIKKNFSSEDYEIIPNITAAQALFAKIKIPWEQVKLLSIHGGKKINFRKILTNYSSMIYCDNRTNATTLAKLLVESFPQCASRPAIFAENLGCNDEKIIRAPLSKIASMNCGAFSILLLLPSDDISDPGLTLGLPDSDFTHENNLITHSEIRAIAISKMKLGPGVMWDIGAGSGSVSVEAASLCPDLQIFAVEQKKERVSMIQNNIDKFGLENIKIIHDDALSAIKYLAPPRAVFIGGGGEDISEILKKSFRKLLRGGRIVVPAILLETKRKLNTCIQNSLWELISVSISRLNQVAEKKMLKAENTIELFIFEKER